MEAFRFYLSPECQERIGAIRSQAAAIAKQAQALPQSEFERLQPIFEGIFRLLSDLGDNLVFIEGHGEFEATSTTQA